MDSVWRRLRRQDPEGRAARWPADRASDEDQLGVNRKTAQALGRTIPPSVLARAEETSRV